MAMRSFGAMCRYIDISRLINWGYVPFESDLSSFVVTFEIRMCWRSPNETGDLEYCLGCPTKRVGPRRENHVFNRIRNVFYKQYDIIQCYES